MFFSIIVPVYNVERYLEECIESILQQTFTDYELILVDDGSKDSSGKICDVYQTKCSSIKVIHKRNGGAAESRNVGLDISKGRYIIFLDSDDYIAEKTFLEQIACALDKEQDIVLYNYKKYYEGTGRLGGITFHYPKISESDHQSDILYKLVEADAFYCTAWLKAISSKLLKENEIRFQTGIRSEDQEWYYHVVLKARTYVVADVPFVVYRQREGSVTATFSEQHLKDNIALLEKWCAKIKSNEIDREFQYALLASIAKLYTNLLIAYSSLNSDEKRKHKMEMKNLSWLLKYDLNKRVQKINSVYKVFGLAGTVRLLHLAKIILEKKS